MILKTERLIIRHIVADDWKSIKEIWVDFNTSALSQYDKPHITDDADVQPRIAKWAAANSGTEHMVNENFFPWGNRPCQQINLYYLISLKDETQIPLDRNFKALDDLGNERTLLNMCWIPLEDVPNKNIYPPQAKEYIMNLPDEIVYFVYKE